MTWYQEGPAIYRDVDVCRRTPGHWFHCGDAWADGCGAMDVWWCAYAERLSTGEPFPENKCFNTAPWGQPMVWYAPDVVVGYTCVMFVAEFYNTCADGQADDLHWLNCHATPTIPGREVVYAEERE